MARGLYGQNEGNEHRFAGGGSLWLSDRISDNEVAEGGEEAHLRKLYVAKNWTGFTAYTEKLKAEGHSVTRVQKMVTLATIGKVK